MQTQALELRLQALKDGRLDSRQEFLRRRSSTQRQTPNPRKMPRERSRICERVHRQSRMSRHALLLHLPLHEQNLQGSVRRLHSVQERRDSTLVQLWATSLPYRIATIARDQHRSGIRNPTLKKPLSQLLLLLPKGPHQPRCPIP
jgi:hypothetical protein